MKEQTKRDVLTLCNAAERMREAVNLLWLAHNPECEDVDGDAPTVEEAQEKHSSAFAALQRAEYYARRSVYRDGDQE